MKLSTATSAATAVLGALVLAGCGDTPSDSADPGFLDSIAPVAVVKGRLLRVTTTGTDPTPVAGTVVLSGQNGARVTDEVGPDGRFKVLVLPGDYQVTGTSPQTDGGTAQCAAKATTTTAAQGTPITVDVLCVVG
ncbi:MAG: hypothetical protein NTV23_11270 [Propionibacteriales bacterium]|nr:hypothetical protein [Propionibacteriales bacterium]